MAKVVNGLLFSQLMAFHAQAKPWTKDIIEKELFKLLELRDPEERAPVTSIGREEVIHSGF